MNRVRIVITLIILKLIFAISSNAQEQVYIIDSLDNGLKIYLVPQDKDSKEKIEIRLVMPVGSIHEGVNTPTGVAHFLEHIAFDGTKHFPKNAITKYIESIGSSFGTGINAYTGYDRTVFFLSLPQTDISVLDTSLLIASDWLGDISFDNDAIKKERNIILEELRRSEEPDSFYKSKIGKGIHLNRNPIGTYRDIKRINKKHLTKYYNQYYHTDIASLIISSKYPSELILRKVKDIFSSKKKKNISKPNNQSLVYKGKTIQSEVDTILPEYSLDILFPHRYQSQNNENDIIQIIYRKLINKYLYSVLSKDNDISISNDWYLSDTYHLVISLKDKDKQRLFDKANDLSFRINTIKNDGIKFIPIDWLEQNINSVLEEIQIVEKDYPSEAKIDYLIDNIILNDFLLLDIAQKERIKSLSKNISISGIDSILRNILTANEYPVLNYLSKTKITAKDKKNLSLISDNFNKSKKTLALFSNFEVNNNDEEQTYSDSQIDELFSRAENLVNKKYSFSKDNDLCAKEYKYYPNLDIHHYLYKNNVELIIKHIDSKDDFTSMYISGEGGIDRISDTDYNRLEGLPAFLDMGTIEGLSAEEYNNLMLSAEISLSTTMTNFRHGYIAKIHNANLDNLFRFTKLKMLASEIPLKELNEYKDEQIKLIKSTKEESLLDKMMKRSSSFDMDKAKDDFLLRIAHPSKTKADSIDISLIDKSDLEDFYHSLYSLPNRKKIVLLSNQSPELILSKFEQYMQFILSIKDFDHNFLLPEDKLVIGSDNAPNEIYSFKDSSNDTTALTVHNIFASEINNTDNKLKDIIALKLIRHILASRTLSELREKSSIVYTPYAFIDYIAYPKFRYIINLENTIDISNMDKLQIKIKEIINDLKSRPIDNSELENIKLSFINNKATALSKTNLSEWVNILTELTSMNISLSDYENYDNILKSISPIDLQKSIQRFL